MTRAERILDAIYEDVHFRLNPSDDECWHCGGEGYTFDCIDGCYADADVGCEDCSRDCVECKIWERKITAAVRVEVLKMLDVEVAAAFLKREGRVPPETMPKNILINMHAGRVAHKDFTDQERADSACWVECLL